ncbi:hypothetical protein PG990_008232 [Apiospora arundinis]
MLQPWLYFGLLSVVTDEPFTIQDFTRLDDDGNALLTSDCLESLVTRWSNKIASQPWSKDEGQFREWYKRLEMYLLRAREIVLWTKHGDASPYKRFDTVVMSIAVLGEYLSEALYDLFREREWETPVIQSWRSSEVLDCGKPLRKIMRHNGWCPYKIVGLDSNWTSPMSVSSLWFFANLAAPKADEHTDGAGRGLLCNSSVCHFMDVKKAQRELKKLALSRLNEPYTLANQILVMDSYLATLVSAKMSPVEIVALIRTSAWSQRLWTFNEGWRFSPTIPSHVVDDIIFTYTSSKVWKAQNLAWSLQSIAGIRNELMARVTGYPSDEGICLASILGLKVDLILDAPIDDRLKVLWSLLPRVPFGMAFSTASRKLTAPGYRWAPASFMGDSETERWAGPQGTHGVSHITARPTDLGLLAELFCSIYPVDVTSKSLASLEESKGEVIRVIRGEHENWTTWMLRDETAN